MSYAIIETGGKQFRVCEGREYRVPLLGKETGDSIDFVPLLVASGDQPIIDGERLGAWRVRCRLVSHGRFPKITVFKFKRRKQYSRQRGHRQDFTTVKVEKIEQQSE